MITTKSKRTLVKQVWLRSMFFVVAAALALTQPLKVDAQNQILLIPDVSANTECENTALDISYLSFGGTQFLVDPIEPATVSAEGFKKEDHFRVAIIATVDYPVWNSSEFTAINGMYCIRDFAPLSGKGAAWGGGQCPFMGGLYINALIPFAKPEPSDSGSICFNTTITLTSKEIVETCKSSADAGIVVKWYYKRGTSATWIELNASKYLSLPQSGDTKSETKATFSLEQLLSDVGQTIDATTAFHFKIIASRDGYGVDSEIVELSFSPPPPSITGTITTEASCSNSPTGKIKLPTITSIGNVRYVLRTATEGAPTDCDASDPETSCLGNVYKSGVMPANRIIDEVKSGNYVLIIANDGGEDGGCYNAYDVTVDRIDPLVKNGEPTVSDITCPNESDGSVTLRFNGGQTPITISGIKSAPSVHNDRTITVSGLEAKTYNMRASDNCDTKVDLSFTIGSPPATPTISIASQNPTCNNPGNGAVRVNIVKGSVTQNITLQCYRDGALFTPTYKLGDPNLIVDLPAGDYRFVVYDTDRQSCGSNETSCTLTPASTLGISYEDLTHVSCYGNNTGSFKLVGSGAASYKYSIDGISWSGNPIFTSLYANTYTARVRRDIDGCLDEASVSILVTQPSQLAQSVTANSIACHNSNGGSISITASGGEAPYTFVLVDETLFEIEQTPSGNTYTFNSLDEGTYNVYVKDKNGCTTTASTHTFVRPSELLFTSATLTNPACYGDTGSINPTAGGGTVPYTFKYKKAEDSDIATSWSSFTASTPILAGQYNLKVVDANGCETSYNNNDIVEIAQPSQPLSISLTASDYNGLQISCHGLSDGSITANAQGGQAPYLYSTNGTTYQTDAYFGSLSAGSYTVYVKDALGCVRSATISLQQASAPISLAVADVGHVDCGESTNGYIQLNALGGHTSGTGIYSFRIEPSGEWQSSSTFNGLTAGPYTIKVKDNNECSAIANTTVISTGNLQVNISSYKGAQCTENPDGWIELSATGGSGSYQFAIDNGEWQTSPLFNDLTPGEHACKVRDSNGCSNFTLYNLPRISTLDLTLNSISHTTCPLDEDGAVTLQSSGGSGGYQYRCVTTNSGWTSSSSYSGFGVGTYTFEVKDTDGCTASLEVTITTQSTLTIAVVSVQHLACAESTIGSIEVAASGSTSYSYQINGGSWLASATFEGLGAGNHTIAVKDENGCIASTEASVNVELPPLTIISANALDVSCHGGNNGSIAMSVTGGTTPYSYKLRDITQSESVLNSLTAGIHSVTVVDAGGCAAVQNVEVKQPASPLSGSVEIRPLCPGYSTGEITVYAQGGTAPYRYACNDEPFTHHIISNRALGTHSITIIDFNECTHTLQAEVTRNDISPNVNFLVSTKQNAIDTLVAKEICTPVPDSIRWEFDPLTKIVEEGESPVITFDQANSYWVRLTAYYGGCDFVTEKTISINPYDPDTPSNPDFNQGFESFIAFPNPSNGVFTVRAKLKAKQALQLQLYNMSGKLYLNKTIENALDYEELITISNIPAGTYILRGVTQNEARVFKLIIQ